MNLKKLFIPLKEGKVLVTSALPYANGSIHLGHLVEYIQTDIYVRFLKSSGVDAIYCCADDTHGTPIDIKASQLNIRPEEIIKKYHEEHISDFSRFLIHFDSYYTTNSEDNQKLSVLFFNKAKEAGLIYTKEIELAYCEHCRRFLPDRYVKGRCPVCGAEDQYGDVCEKCHSTYTPKDLIDPYCVICGNTPVMKKSRHYFFRLSALSEKLREWISSNEFIQKEVKNHVLGWIEKGLEDWCISRDEPYFGFKIPGEDHKYFYVWLDAPIGYISSTLNYCRSHNCSFEDYWKGGSSSIIHFIGKDIMYFHLLFWPAMLMTAGFNLPKSVVVHGFLTVNKEKMSKSRGTFLTAKEFSSLVSPELLRFYYAANLTSGIDDIDLDLKDFTARVNNELVSNLANFCYRVLSFTSKNFEGVVLDTKDYNKEFQKSVLGVAGEVVDKYASLEFRQAVQGILRLSSMGNQLLQESEPWKGIKRGGEGRKKAHLDMSLAVNLVRILSKLIYPVMPGFSLKLGGQLAMANDVKLMSGIDFSFSGKINNAEVIYEKIEEVKLMEHIERNEKEQTGEPAKKPGEKLKEKPDDEEHSAGSVSGEGFSSLNLVVARIDEAGDHPNADRLYVLDIDLGGETRRLVAGLKKYYSKEELKGRKIVVVENMKRAVLRGIESQGMLLAGDDGDNVILLNPGDAQPGERVFVEGVEGEPAEEVTIDLILGLKMSVRGGVAEWKGKPLRTAGGVVKAEGLKDGALIR